MLVMHQSRGSLIAAAAVSCLLLTGCGSDGDDKSGSAAEPSVIGTPVGKPIQSPEATPQRKSNSVPEPDPDAPYIEHVKYELATRTVKMAGVPARTSTTCDKKSVRPAAGAKVTCTVTYEGIKVTWPVEFTGKPGFGGMGDGYEAQPSTGILTREAALTYFLGNHREPNQTKHRCTPMPRVTKVPLGQPTKYQCSYFTAKASTRGEDMWITQSLLSTADGPRARM
ncbi:hypothetical protein [Streptomyces sp. NPDC055189]